MTTKETSSEWALGFTGTQEGMTPEQKDAFTKWVNDQKPSELHHGDCVGADEDAYNICKSSECPTVYWICCHPPEISKSRAFTKGNDMIFPPRPYLDRNHDIVDMSREMVATPKGFDEEIRSGTWATVRYARKKGKKVTIIFPDGLLEVVTAPPSIEDL